MTFILHLINAQLDSALIDVPSNYGEEGGGGGGGGGAGVQVFQGCIVDIPNH